MGSALLHCEQLHDSGAKLGPPERYRYNVLHLDVQHYSWDRLLKWVNHEVVGALTKALAASQPGARGSTASKLVKHSLRHPPQQKKRTWIACSALEHSGVSAVMPTQWRFMV